MKRLLLLSSIVAGIIFSASSCEDTPPVANFEDMEGVSIYNFITENDSLSEFTSFLQILDTSGVGDIVSAYNPYNSGYTLFLPNNQAIEEFISESDKFASFDELLGDVEYATSLAKYHVVNLAIDANDFPFGALPAYTLSGDLLTVNFILGEDSAYYSINNQAPVKTKNIEVSNGFIHVITKVLKPITLTSYNWIEATKGFSIFKEAVDATGFDELLNLNLKIDSFSNPITLFIEHDTTYNKKGIYTLQDLLDTLNVENTDYSSMGNGLYQYVGYHIIDANAFLDDFLDKATNYTTFSNLPLSINGKGLDIAINLGKQVFDTIVVAGDTTIINYVGVNYDESNIVTQSGAIHIIDRVMTLQEPTKATVTFEFYEEPTLNKYRELPGEYLITDPALLYHITWKGPELIFVEEADTDHPAWGDDYLKMDGNFSIKYTLPKIVNGKYDVHFRGNAYNPLNAVVEIYIDGKKLGGLLDLSEGGTANNTYADFLIGTVEFNTYETHEVEVRSLIPGKLEWDYVRLEPSKN